MKVLDLQCAHDHRFEGWFDSEDDFQSQLARGLLTCPMCGSDRVQKKLSAPRLNLVGARVEEGAAQQAHAVAQQVASMTPEQIQDIVMGTIAAAVDTGDLVAGSPEMRNTTQMQAMEAQEPGEMNEMR